MADKNDSRLKQLSNIIMQRFRIKTKHEAYGVEDKK